MSRQDPTTAESVACPYLGLADDRDTRFSFPAQAHRCHAGPEPTLIELAYQGTYCLSSRYTTCDRYHSPANGAVPDPTLSAEAAVAAEAEALAEATGVGVPLVSEPVATAPMAMASTPEGAGPGMGLPEPEHGAAQPGSAVPGSAPTGVPATEPQPQRAAQAVWTRHGWSTPELEAALDEARGTSRPAEPAAEPTEVAAASSASPAAQVVGPAASSEPEAASPEPPVQPASFSAEPASAQAETAAEPKAKPTRPGRRPATPPPSEWRNAKTSSVLAAVLPSYDLVTGQPTPGDPTADADVLDPESIAIVTPKGRRPTSPPPSAWKSTTTTSILAAILPPVEPMGGEASTNGPTPADVEGFPPPAEATSAEPAATAEPATVEAEAATDPQPQAPTIEALAAGTAPETSPTVAEIAPLAPASPAVEAATPIAETPTLPEAAAPPAAAPAVPVIPAPSPAEPAAPIAAAAPNAEPAPAAEPTAPAEPAAPVEPATPVAAESATSGSSLTNPAVWPPPGSEPSTQLPEGLPTVPPRKRPWFADATPVAAARARLPETAPVPLAPGTVPGSPTADARSRKTPQRPGARRNVRRRAFILIVVLVIATLAAAIATGSLERLLPAGLLPAAVILPTSLITQGPFAPSISPVGLSTPSVVLSQGPSPSPTLLPPTAQPTPIVHVVQPGESLTSIAKRYGLTPQAIRRANNLKDANLLRVGQKLVIPPPR